MGLITKEVKIKWHPNNRKWYEEKGYTFTKFGNIFKIKIEHLLISNSVKVDIQCDCCGEKLKNIGWATYKRCVKEDGKYYCRKCAIKLYGSKNSNKTKLKNSISFEDWCNQNGKQNILSLWDYELNDCKPSDISYGTKIKYYFKCPKGLHPSELKSINDFTHNKGNITCKICNSFAQYLIDNYGENALKMYWDYQKNTVDPWVISICYSKKIWIKCQEKDYHESYNVRAADFYNGVRCAYCGNFKIHPLDSLGKLLEDKDLLHLWSDKNKKSAYKYGPMSNKKVWWKCSNGHDDYYRSINGSKIANFRCPECQYSLGEERINNYFINLGFVNIKNKDYKKLDNVFKNMNNYYIPQKKFDGLIGLKGGLLSYDFYLPNLNHNLLIEYQGQQHEKYISGFHKSKKDFLKQQEHDRRKREYAQNNNINLLEIWYYDYDNIEEILDSYFKNINVVNF